jgi:hypothetical protein
MADRTETGEPNRTRFSDQAARDTLALNPLIGLRSEGDLRSLST